MLTRLFLFKRSKRGRGFGGSEVSIFRWMTVIKGRPAVFGLKQFLDEITIHHRIVSDYAAGHVAEEAPFVAVIDTVIYNFLVC
ncbi:hypothetical protein [Rhizobium sp. BR 362]|uniref:hypothetical protein n=1 Tax=Rhizobium sp. BR 362 TaxID=3040670 RepID=UPI002F42F150